jgi:hypothetical protein
MGGIEMDSTNDDGTRHERSPEGGGKTNGVASMLEAAPVGRTMMGRGYMKPERNAWRPHRNFRLPRGAWRRKQNTGPTRT